MGREIVKLSRKR